MQQHNVNWRSLLNNSPEAATVPSPRIIKIEETSAYHRNQHRTQIDRQIEVGQNSSRTDTQAVLTTAIGEHRICEIFDTKEPVAGRLFHAHPLSTGNCQLVEVQWQGAFKLEQDPLDARYLIYIVLSGSLEQKIGSLSERLHQRSQTFQCSVDTATIVSPSQTVESIASEEGKVLLISIDRDSLEAALSKLLVGGASIKGNRPLKQPAIFLPSLDLTSELGLSLKKFIQFLWEVAAHNSSDFSSFVLQKLEQTFLACALEGLPSNYSEELLYQTDGALACHVRKAQAFIESHLHEDIKLGDIAAATKVCSRLLQKAFSHHCGCSPMRFLAQSRLQRIRQELERSTTDTKIVDVMMRYGFTQGGKFAKEYQQLFGEKPSDTLKRGSQSRHQHHPLWHEIDDPLSARIAGGRAARTSSQTVFPSGCLPVQRIGNWLSAISTIAFRTD
jgi:AraC-like DNA-binding protein